MSIIISVISLIISLFALISSWILWGKQNKLHMGEVENYVRNQISNARKEFEDVGKELEKNFDKLDEPKKEIYRKRLESKKENLLNIYDDACCKYLDSKIDKRRFKKSYSREIRQVVENENFKNYLGGPTIRYECLMKVYKKWNKQEK